MEEEYKSRTQKKKEDKALQKLGDELVSLSIDQLENMKLPDELFKAIGEAKTFKSHGAKRRQAKYIGVLMRGIDLVPIQNALKNIKRGDHEKAMVFKKIESWRDEIKEGNNNIIEEVMRECPAADRQRLNQLARNTRNISNKKIAVKGSRELFRYLKEIFNPK